MKTMSSGEQKIFLDVISEKVSEEFGLDGNYRITEFNSKKNSITFSSPNYTVKVTCSGDVEEYIYYECQRRYGNIDTESIEVEEVE